MTFTIRGTIVKVDQLGVPVQFGTQDVRNSIGTASFLYESLQNPGLTLVPTEGDVVGITGGGIAALFTGKIAQVQRGGDPVGRNYLLTCQDRSAPLYKLRLPADWIVPASCLNDGTAVYKLLASTGGNNAAGDCTWTVSPATALSLSVSPSGSLVSKSVLTLPGFTIKRGTAVSDALNQIATMVGGAVWFVDHMGPNAGFHWNNPGTAEPWIFSANFPGDQPSYWPETASTFYNYSEFIDRTQHYQRVTVDNGSGLTATATDWPALGDQAHPISATEPILEAAAITDSTLATQAAVDRRAWAELNRGKVRRTVRLTFDRSTQFSSYVPRVGHLADVVNPVWGDVDVTPVPHVTREVPTHSNIRGELVPTARGRFVIQKITPRVRKATQAADIIAYELELGDYEDSLAATLARAI